MKNNRRHAFLIMSNLIILLRPLWQIMIIAVLTGSIGFLFSFAISLLPFYIFFSIYGTNNFFIFSNFSSNIYTILLILSGFFRSIFYYLEQFCNHFIAFKILAELRKKLFFTMRKLAPAKLENKNKGDLVSLLMADIELLEVFYAHTISPILIALCISIVLFIYFYHLLPFFAFYSLFCQIFIGIFIPYFASSKAAKIAFNLRNALGEMNDTFLDKLKGIREIIQYSSGNKNKKLIEKINFSIGENQKKLKKNMNFIQILVDSSVIFFSILEIFISYILVKKGIVIYEKAILACFLQISSFAPFINLAFLGNILSQTLACGERVLSLLEEKPKIVENLNSNFIENDEKNLKIKNVNFSYDKNINILKNINLNISKPAIIGIKGESGSGKSTLAKLIMRFWDVDSGEIILNGNNIKNYPLKKLYENFGYMTQNTDLFIGSLRENLKIARQNATDEEINIALKKASIFEYIDSLPDKLDTFVEESGKNFSSGERQRIGLARLFLSDRNFLILDEPTSNLDLQNEAIILKALSEERKNKFILLVSHRETTLSICDKIFKMENGELLPTS